MKTLQNPRNPIKNLQKYCKEKSLESFLKKSSEKFHKNPRLSNFHQQERKPHYFYTEFSKLI